MSKTPFTRGVFSPGAFFGVAAFALGVCSGCVIDERLLPPEGYVEAGASAPELTLPTALEAPPRHFSDFGLYPAAPDLRVLADDAFAYEPRYPLWSNGSEKHRVVAVPGALEPPDPDELPVGTTFFKTFTFETEGSRGQALPVETRVIRKGPSEFEYYRYRWNEAGTEALLIEDPREDTAVVSYDGTEFEHQIPGQLDCERCHAAGETPILGYTALQLDGEPLAAAGDDRTEAVMGYVIGNCIHCHNGKSSDQNAFDMRPDVFLDNVVDRPTDGSASGAGLRVAAGKPQDSVLYVALAGGDEAREIQPMPPLGVQLRDREALNSVREWIEGLE